MSVAAVVLAAGGGTRFEGPTHKLLSGFRGHPLVWWALAAAGGAHFDEVAVIVGAVDLGVAVPDGVRVIENPGLGERAGVFPPGGRVVGART